VQDGKIIAQYADYPECEDCPVLSGTANIVLTLPYSDENGSPVLGIAPINIVKIASVTPVIDHSSVVADGADHRTAITLPDLKDEVGRPVPDGNYIGIAVDDCLSYDENGECIHSYRGKIIGGFPASQDNPALRYFPIQNGQVVFEYSSEGYAVDAGQETISLSVVFLSQALKPIQSLTAIQIQLLSPGAIVTITPGDLTANGGDNRSQVVISGLTEPDGVTPMPDGSRVGVTAADCAAAGAGGSCINSIGGVIFPAGTSPGDGAVASNNPDFRIFTVAGGQIQAAYSSQGIVLGINETKTARIAVVRADADGNIINATNIGVGKLLVHGTTYAYAAGPWQVLPGSTAQITVSYIYDSAGNSVPDGTRLLVSADNCASKNTSFDGCVQSAGGSITNGTPSGAWRLFTVQNESITATYSPEGATAGGYARIQIVPANLDGTPVLNENGEVFSLVGGVCQIYIKP
jgi:hypothetical protein